MSKVTIKDVARHAGVQPSTVSRAINGHPDVNSATRARVMESIRILAYVPDRAAKSFRTGKTRSVSVFLPITGSEFYNRLLESIDEALEVHDYDAGIFPLLSARRLARYQDPASLPYHTDGLVFASLDPEQLYTNPLTIQGLPVVVLDVPTSRYDNVTLDNRLGGRLAAEHLHLRPAPTAILNVEERFETPFASGVFRERVTGFRETWQATGLDPEGLRLLTCAFGLEQARAAARTLLRTRRGPLNIFTTCDLLAYGVLDELRHTGLTPGEEVRVVGFDDELQARERELTTLRQPVEALGQAVVELLMDRIAQPERVVRHRQFRPELQVRQTT